MKYKILNVIMFAMVALYCFSETETFDFRVVSVTDGNTLDVINSIGKKYTIVLKDIDDDKAKYTDWSRRDDIKAELKVDLIMLLAKNQYPPNDRNEIYQERFEQAENFKKYQGKQL